MQTRFFHFDHGKFWVETTEVPKLRPDQFLVKTRRSLVSVGTETACNRGHAGWPTGVHGYSNVGVVVQAGANVTRYQCGDRLKSDQPHTDYYLGNDADHYYKVPDTVTDEQATFVPLGTVALYALEQARISAGRPVVVVGQGTVGQLTQQLARACGAGWVIAVDTDAQKLALARELGADEAIAPGIEALHAALARYTVPAPAPIFIEVSGSVEAVKWILDASGVGSRIVIAGTYLKEVALNPFVLVEKQLEIFGALQPKCPEDLILVHPYSRKMNNMFILDLLSRKRLNVDKLYDALISPDDVMRFYETAVKSTNTIRQPIIKWEE